MLEGIDSRLLALLARDQLLDDATLRTISLLETARNAILRLRREADAGDAG